ncbi:hypothetical protein TREES_T100000394 [Tupaia chinensis]|uniref:Uncharacterized protein n=1 Tax=Tupaia chinensis TaxID=246437 RepID=L9KV30_TUPCH|nr:hypothetical protein TREES_T100000394 [Tupaia chinensis]
MNVTVQRTERRAQLDHLRKPQGKREELPTERFMAPKNSVTRGPETLSANLLDSTSLKSILAGTEGLESAAITCRSLPRGKCRRSGRSRSSPPTPALQRRSHRYPALPGHRSQRSGLRTEPVSSATSGAPPPFGGLSLRPPRTGLTALASLIHLLAT